MTVHTSARAPRIALRPAAVGVRDLYSFLGDLDLDCDVNPCTGLIGAIDPRRVDDPGALVDFVRRLGLTAALANVLDLAERDVAVRVVRQEETLHGDLDDLANLISEYHNTHPLRLDEAALVSCWPHSSGEHVVFVKFSHLIVDLSDVVDLLTRLRAYLRGDEAVRVGARYRHHRATVERYARLPTADFAQVQRELGEVPAPGRKGVPTISASTEQWLPLRRGFTFDVFLSAVTGALLTTIGGGLVLQYPYSRWDFAGKGGYYVEIKPLVVQAGAASRYTPGYFERTRRYYESLGRFTMSELTSFATAFTSGRMPRIVVSDTTFMRPEPGRWRWIPVRSARAFEDLKFLADRSWPGPPLLRLQYKRRFLSPQTATAILGELEQRIGASSGTVGPAD
ncbi:hypothetical protein ACIG87_26005 [Micromonospora sp. NPDC051925]|uniref:hypothetical protein n=1 Tax=Micromonospora sp. NPDC051925 TaxID=3364288 RepID=UPI0037C6A173